MRLRDRLELRWLRLQRRVFGAPEPEPARRPRPFVATGPQAGLRDGQVGAEHVAVIRPEELRR